VTIAIKLSVATVVVVVVVMLAYPHGDCGAPMHPLPVQVPDTKSVIQKHVAATGRDTPKRRRSSPKHSHCL
jgi:hypothetical protein